MIFLLAKTYRLHCQEVLHFACLCCFEFCDELIVVQGFDTVQHVNYCHLMLYIVVYVCMILLFILT